LPPTTAKLESISAIGCALRGVEVQILAVALDRLLPARCLEGNRRLRPAVEIERVRGGALPNRKHVFLRSRRPITRREAMNNCWKFSNAGCGSSRMMSASSEPPACATYSPCAPPRLFKITRSGPDDRTSAVHPIASNEPVIGRVAKCQFRTFPLPALIGRSRGAAQIQAREGIPGGAERPFRF
jgi:hypothetical protein